MLYKEPFLASADGFDSIILTMGCLSDFWRFSSLQDHRWNKQRECQPLHSYNCWLALPKSTEQGHGELHLWGYTFSFNWQLLIDFGCSVCLPQVCIHWSSENMTLHSALLLERCRIIFLGALGLLPTTFTYKWNTDVLEMGKLSCFSVRTVTPAGNFNSDYNSLEITRSYGPVLAAGSQLQGNPFFSPSQAVEVQQHSTVWSWLPCTLHWLQDLSSVGKGCDIWLTEKYEQLPYPLPEGIGPDGNTLQTELGLWITSYIFYPIKILEAQTSLNRIL